MEIVLVWIVLGGIIAGWVLFRKRRKSRRAAGDQDGESLRLATSISTDQEYDNYEVLEVNQSQSSDREYELLGHLETGRISCTCRGFTYTPHDGCVHTKAYIERHKTNDEGKPLELGAVVSRPETSARRNSGGRDRQGNIQPKKALENIARWADTNYVILDTETTGLTGASKIVEVAVIDSHGAVLLNTLVNPGRSPIKSAATEIHGITRDDVRDKPTFTELWPELSSILESHELVLTYNADFDFRLMKQSLEHDDNIRKLGEIPNDCIMQAYTGWWRAQDPKNNSTSYRSLKQAAEECGVQAQNETHRALDDCETTRQLLAHITENLSDKRK